MTKNEAQNLSTWIGIAEYAGVSKDDRAMTQDNIIRINERIKEIIREADRKCNETRGVFDEILVKLTIKECLDQCYNRGMNDELYAGQLKAAHYIEQHFGVEV